MKPKNRFVQNYRDQVRQLLANAKELTDLKVEYDTLGLAASLTDADCIGSDPDLSITAAQFTAAVATVKLLTDIIYGTPAELAKLYVIKT